MKKNICVLVLLFFSMVKMSSAWAKPHSEAMPKKITIGLTPGGKPEIIREQALELAKDIQSEFGLPVEIYMSTDYSGLTEAMKNKKVDFAFFSSLTFVQAEDVAGAKVLLKKVWSEPYYFSAMIARQDSKIKSIEQLKGKKVVFVDKNSTSGYLYPQVMLKKKNIQDSQFSEILFSGNHAHSIEMLEQKKADVAAVFTDDEKGLTGAWTKFSKNKNIKYKTLWISDPIPTDPFCVQKDFYENYPKFTHSLMFLLIDLFTQNKVSKKYSEVLGTHDLLPATSKQYDPVREMVKSMNIEVK